MFRKKKKKRPEISAPKNFEHRVHTSFDAKRGCFVGLPTQWQSLIENLRRPKPMVDPSRITEVELRPKKVSYFALYWFSVLTLRWLLMNGVRRWFPLSCNELHSQRNMCWLRQCKSICERCHRKCHNPLMATWRALSPPYLFAFLSIMWLS